MSAATITPLTKDEALRTYGGPLPPGIDREEYEGSLGALKADGVESLESWEINTIKRVIEHQKSVNVGAPSQDVEAEPNEGDADQSLPTDAKQLEPQAAPQDVEPSEETGEIENVSNGLLDAVIRSGSAGLLWPLSHE